VGKNILAPIVKIEVALQVYQVRVKPHKPVQIDFVQKVPAKAVIRGQKQQKMPALETVKAPLLEDLDAESSLANSAC